LISIRLDALENTTYFEDQYPELNATEDVAVAAAGKPKAPTPGKTFSTTVEKSGDVQGAVESL